MQEGSWSQKCGELLKNCSQLSKSSISYKLWAKYLKDTGCDMNQ